MALTVDPLAIALAALVCDAAFAGIPGLRSAFAAPAMAVDAITRWSDVRLNRERRSATNRKFRGALVVIFIAGVAALLGYGGREITRHVDGGWAIEAVLVAAMLQQRRVFDGVLRVRRALRRHGVAAARGALAETIAADARAFDEHGIARRAIESLVARFCDGIVAPVFWYVVLGLPGLFAYRAINAVARRIGHPSPRHAQFGLAAAKLDIALSVLFAPLSGLVLALAAAFVPAANPARSVRTMLRDSRNHDSPVVGWTAAAAAGALGLALAGPRVHAGATVSGPWIGDGRARATPQDVGRALLLYAVAWTIAAGTIAVLALAAVAG